jgi:hypothetical protein
MNNDTKIQRKPLMLKLRLAIGISAVISMMGFGELSAAAVLYDMEDLSAVPTGSTLASRSYSLQTAEGAVGTALTLATLTLPDKAVACLRSGSAAGIADIFTVSALTVSGGGTLELRNLDNGTVITSLLKSGPGNLYIDLYGGSALTITGATFSGGASANQIFIRNKTGNSTVTIMPSILSTASSTYVLDTAGGTTATLAGANTYYPKITGSGSVIGGASNVNFITGRVSTFTGTLTTSAAAHTITKS